MWRSVQAIQVRTRSSYVAHCTLWCPDARLSYTGDPKTKKWLVDHSDAVFGYPSLIRFSWKTTQTALDARGACQVFYGDEEDEEDAKAAIARAHKFVYQQNKRARYFSDRELDVANDF